MRVLIEQDGGELVEVRDIKSVSPAADILIFFTKAFMRQADLEQLESQLSNITGKRCVMLNPCIEKVVGV